MMTKHEYQDALLARGCEQLGSGLYSNVFAIPSVSHLVIKVGGMDAWTDYIRWSTENGHSGKFAPKVYSLKFYQKSDNSRDHYYVAIMERLTCTIREMSSIAPRSDQVRDYRSMQNRDCEALDFAAYVRELRSASFYGDMHDQNVMVRHDGQLVITDPISGYSSAKYRIKRGAIV